MYDYDRQYTIILGIAYTEWGKNNPPKNIVFSRPSEAPVKLLKH